MENGNAFAPEFMRDYNRRFARAAQNPHDAHRPLQVDEELAQVFSWQEERTMSGNLTVHFKRKTYLVEPGPQTLPLAGKRVVVSQWDDGRVEIHCEGLRLPFSIFDKNPNVNQGEIVENKRLGAMLSVIHATQVERDRLRLSSKKITLREKERIRIAATPAPTP